MINSKIPISFKQFSATYNIKWDDKLCDQIASLGSFSEDLKEIVLTNMSGINKLPEDRIRQTFYHELAHCICRNTGNEIYKDEVFVDLLGRLLMQYLDTVQYK
jgi:hypothetical protein